MFLTTKKNHTTKKNMEGVKYLIRDFENTHNTRLVDFRRHVNSFIHGGGNTSSQPQQQQYIKNIIEQLKHADPELFVIIKQVNAVPSNLNDISKIKEYLIKHPPTKAQIISSTQAMAQYYNHLHPNVSTHQPSQNVSSINEDENEDDDDDNDDDEESDISLPSNDNEEDNQPPSSQNNPNDSDDHDEQLQQVIMNEVQNQMDNHIMVKEKIFNFIQKFKTIKYFYKQFGILAIKKQQQVRKMRNEIILKFQKYIQDTLHRYITPVMALKVILLLVQMYKNEK